MAWLWFFPLNGVLGLGAYLAARHAFRQPPGAPRMFAAITIAWAWLTLGMELLGSFGLIAPWPLLSWSGLGLLGGLAAVRRNHEPTPVKVEPPRADVERWTAILAVGLVGWAIVLLGARSLLLPVKVVSDGPIYHLYFAARWWKAGRIFLIATPFGENAATYFPANGDVWFTWLMLSWGGDRLAKVGQAPFFLTAALATYAIARRLGAGRSAAVIATCWFASSTPLLLFALEPNVDMIFVAGYLVAAYFFLRYALGDDDESALALGALAAGGALGSKAIATVFVPPLLGLAILAVLVRPVAQRPRVYGITLVLVLPMVTAGFWYARNLLLTGNPLYPLHVGLFGREILPGWYGRDAMKWSQYYLPVSDVGSLADILLAVFDPRAAALWTAALVWGWFAGGPNPARRRALRCVILLVVLNIALFWLLVPYRTQQRFMLQAVALAAVPVALFLDQSRWLRALAVVGLALHILSQENWPFPWLGPAIPWDFSPLIPSVIPSLVHLSEYTERLRNPTPQSVLQTQAAAALALGVAMLAAVWFWERAVARGGPVRWLLAAALGGTVAWLAALAVFPPETSARFAFFPIFREYINGWLALDSRSGTSGTRVAYAGTDLPYYLLGVGLRNEVFYVNIDAHRDWLLHDYRRESKARGEPLWPNPRPGWDRIHPDYSAWLANLRAAGIQVLVVAKANPDEGIHNLADSERFPIERVWADAHPETFEPLYGIVEQDPNFRLYRVRPPR